MLHTDSPFLVFTPIAKLPQIKIGGTKVVIDDIYDKSDPIQVGINL